MIKKRLIRAAYFSLAAMGVYFLLLMLYFLISEPDELTWYEEWMTVFVSLFVTNWLEKEV